MKKGILPATCWLFILLFSVPFPLLAQSPASPVITLIVEPYGTNTFDPIQDPTGHPFATDTAKVTLVVEVSDTGNLATIHVKLGTSPGGSQVLLQDYAFDVSSGLPAGTSYRREGYVVYLGLGNHSGFSAVYATVSLENGSGVSGNATASFQ